MIWPRRALLSFVAALLLVGCDEPEITVYVVRHAEKVQVEGGMLEGDPQLTEAGARRAEALVATLKAADVRAVFSTPYQRTRDTAAPVARAKGLEVRTVAGDDVAGLVAQLRKLGGGSALVVGHSNTVPAILKALGVQQEVTLDESEYGDLFVVTVAGNKATLERRRFGDSP